MLRPNTLHRTAANPVAVLVLAQVTRPAAKVDAGAVMGQLSVQHTRFGRKEKCHDRIRKETDSLSVVEAPGDKLWGAQPRRSLEHFSFDSDWISSRNHHVLRDP